MEVSVNMIRADIDELLDSTIGIDENIEHLIISNYEIDLLLEKTEDW